MADYIDIAVGVLKRKGMYCLSQRQKHQSFADKWEFPGGKVEVTETIEQALIREYQEELGINTLNWQPLIEIPWDYGDVAVCLHVFITEDYEGLPKGLEGQEVDWFDIESLQKLEFPAANQEIIKKLGACK